MSPTQTQDIPISQKTIRQVQIVFQNNGQVHYCENSFTRVSGQQQTHRGKLYYIFQYIMTLFNTTAFTEPQDAAYTAMYAITFSVQPPWHIHCSHNQNTGVVTDDRITVTSSSTFLFQALQYGVLSEFQE